MDTSNTPIHLPPYHGHHSSPHEQSLPPLSVLTNEVNRRSSVSIAHQSHPNSIIDTRDSGNWSQSQSKHSSTISACPSVPIQSILNSDTPMSNGQLPPMNRPYGPADDDSFRSHRSSIDSRVNYGMGHLALNPPSPTVGHMNHTNGSRASLASSLAHQRGIVPDSYGQGSIFPRMNVDSPNRQIPRQAPIIHPNPRNVSGMPDPMASAPTKGFAWAFPDKESPPDLRPSSSGESSNADQNGDPGSTRSLSPAINYKEQGAGTYSRTPELRVSHKMAERKRRSEMKQLFEELHSILPHGPNTKSSKWEILAKAIDHIKGLRYSDQQMRRANEQLRHEAGRIRQLEEENMHLRHELQAARQQHDPNGRTSSYASLATTIGHDGPQHPPPHPMASAHSLPPPHPSHHQGPPGQWGRPISSASSSHSVQPAPQSPNAMTGIEYGSQIPTYGGR